MPRGRCWNRCCRFGKGTGRPIADTRDVVEAIAGKYRTRAPWRGVAERFGNWNTINHQFNAWAKDGTFAQMLAGSKRLPTAQASWIGFASIDSTIVRVHQHGVTLARAAGGRIELRESASGAY